MIRHVAGAAMLLVVAAACGSDIDHPFPPSPTPAAPDPIPRLDLTPEEQEALAGALDVFGKYIDAYVELATFDGTLTSEHQHDVVQHTSGASASDLAHEVARNYLDNRVNEGELTWTLVEPDFDLNRELPSGIVPTVYLHVCLDAANWRVVDRTTGEVAEDARGRHMATATATWTTERDHGPDGWAIAGWDPDAGRPC